MYISLIFTKIATSLGNLDTVKYGTGTFCHMRCIWTLISNSKIQQTTSASAKHIFYYGTDITRLAQDNSFQKILHGKIDQLSGIFDILHYLMFALTFQLKYLLDFGDFSGNMIRSAHSTSGSYSEILDILSCPILTHR